MLWCIKLQHWWKLVVAVGLLVISIVAPLLAQTGWCLTCVNIPCESPCVRGSYAGSWSDCKTCWVLLGNHACTACGWLRYQSVRPPCHPPYQWEVVVFDNPPPFPIPGIVWYRCVLIGGWLRCR